MIKRFLILGFLAFFYFQSNYAVAGLREDIRRADDLFRQDKVRECVNLLLPIHRRYKDNQIVSYLLGQSYYRAGKFREAYYFFKQIDRSTVETRGALAYGFSMFRAKRWENSVSGFRKVRGADRPLANFYAGLAHIRLRNFDAAEYSLRAATPLERGLNSTRLQILQQLRRQSSVRPSQTSYGNQFVAPIVQAPPTVALPSGPEIAALDELGAEKLEDSSAKAEEAKPKTAAAYMETSVYAEYLSEVETSSFSGISDSTTQTTGPKVGGNSEVGYKLDPNSSGQQASLSLRGEFSAQNYSASGTDVKYQVNEDATDIIPGVSTEESTTKYLEYEAGPQFSLPIVGSVEAAGGYDHSERLPEFKPVGKKSFSGPRGSLSVSLFDILRLTGSGSLYDRERVSPEDGTVATTQDTNISGQAEVSLPSTITVAGGVSQTSTSKPEYAGIDSLSGFASVLVLDGSISKGWENSKLSLKIANTERQQPDTGFVTGFQSLTKATAELSRSFKFGLRLKGSAEYQDVGAYYRTGLCPVGSSGSVETCGENTETASASGSIQVFSFGVDVTPVEWGYVKFLYSHSQRTYSVAQPELENDFKNKVVSLYTDFSISIGVSYSL